MIKQVFFATRKIPTTHIFRNHLEQIHHLLNDFCEENDYYWIVFGEGSDKAIKPSRITNYLNSKQPQILKYYLCRDNTEVIRIDIDNGVTINIINGDYLSYGLFGALLDVFSTFRVPALVTYIRRWWAINIPILLWLTVVMLGLANLLAWSFFIGIVAGLVTLILVLVVVSSLENDEDVSELLLNTRIEHAKYSDKLGMPIYAFLTSSAAIFTFVASFATIVSTIILIVQ